MRNYLVRYRLTLMVDLWADTKEGAEKQVDGIVLGIPNSFQTDVSELPHGSEISLIKEGPA